MTGRSLFDFIDAASRPDAERYLEKNRQTNSKSYDFPFRHSDGREVRTLLTTSPMEDPRGKSFIGALGMVTDITEQVLAEQELRKSEQKFRYVLDNSIDVIYELSIENRSYDYISPSAFKVLGVPPYELIQHGLDKLMELIYEEDKNSVANYYKELFAPSQSEGVQMCIEYRIRYNKNEYRWIRETATTVCDSQHLPVAVVGTICDITSRREAELVIQRMNGELERRVAERTIELEVSNKELESFSYSVSHDLRAPLRSIDGFSKILLEDYFDNLDERGQNYLKRVRAATQRMGQLIDDLLTLSRVTRCIINCVDINISDLAASLIQKYKMANPSRTLQFRNSPGIIVHADANLVRVLMDNLLNNAWKFSSRRDDAIIELGIIHENTDNGEIIYFIRDNGVGFDMAYVHKLFGAFQRLHPVSEFEGTGIGLATVQRIVRRHGGRVWAEGAVGQGATFYFTLPM